MSVLTKDPPKLLPARLYAYITTHLRALSPARHAYYEATHFTRNPSKKTMDQALKTYQEAMKTVKVSEEDIQAELAYNED